MTYCVLCGEEADHKHTDGGACCSTCCTLWGVLADEPEQYSWIERIWQNNMKLIKK
jgi:hypothetical protein